MKANRIESATLEINGIHFEMYPDQLQVTTESSRTYIWNDVIKVVALRNFLSRWINDKRTRDNKLAKRNGTQGIYSQDA